VRELLCPEFRSSAAPCAGSGALLVSRPEGGVWVSGDTRSTRSSLLELLLRHKSGLSIEELAAKLSISRNTVRQHLSSLEREGMVAIGNVRRSVGRPIQLYTLTQLGLEQFPRQYSLLSGLLLSTVRDLHGLSGVTALLGAIAGRMTDLYARRVEGGLRVRRWSIRCHWRM
jgi:predicted ArsR family transcriptional regulator